MNQIYLQRMLDELPNSALPPNWQGFNLEQFSRDKTLWGYQQQALANALKALWKYYGTPGLNVAERKQAFAQWYRDFGLEDNLDIQLDTSNASKRKLAKLLENYYPVDTTGKFPAIPYVNFANRMAFWMATGSGKTLVIVKLVEMLYQLMRRNEIPENDILILAHRDDLLEQLRLHIDQFNTIGDLTIRLHELKDYGEVKYSQPNLFSSSECHVFYYRSDNLSDEQKEKIIDFRGYDNDGRWYILLDEAHKGDKEDSKRQHLYSILSRNGFLFNFSATFTDPRDIITTAFNFNLSEFIRSGFGKHIYVFNQETGAFKKKEDFTESEKQKIVLKALIMLCLARQEQTKVRKVDARLYHKPLLMTLVNSVNTKDADLKMFFRELAKIGKGEIEAGIWEEAITDLRVELGNSPVYLYETSELVKVADKSLDDLTQRDFLEQVFNTARPGEIEVLVRPSDRQEIAFKLKTCEEPFALIRIGDISDWLTQELNDYEINTHFNEESFFERLNKPDSDINILLGSRSFYEGWDSNRPNVVMYINIGVGMDAKKFILQSVGRGARIEPLKDKRKRFSHLKTAGLLSAEEESLYSQVRQDVLLLESEFIFGTNRDALETVISELDQEEKQAAGREISLEINEAAGNKPLLVPVYRQQDQPFYKKQKQSKFSLSESNLDLLMKYMDYLTDDRVLLALHNTAPHEVAALRFGVSAPGDHFRTDGLAYKNIDVLVGQVLRYTSLFGKDLQQFKPLEEEINNFKHVRVMLPDIDFERFEILLKASKQKPKIVAELKEKYDTGQMSFEDFLSQAQILSETDQFDYKGQVVLFKRISQHYYLPLLVSEDDKIEYIQRLVRVRSEVDFLKKLENYLQKTENKFKSYDWWLFSHLDETTDQINIPYYNPVENKILNFKPDFIFWLQKGLDYHIIFVDPKGTGRSEYEHKVDGFRGLFERDDQPIVFEHEGMKVQVHLFLFTADRNFVADYYRRFWLDSPDKILEGL